MVPSKQPLLIKIKLSSSLSVTPDELVLRWNDQKARAKEMIKSARQMCERAKAMRRTVRPFIP